MATAYSSLHSQKTPRRPTMKAKPVPPVQTLVATSAAPSLSSLDPLDPLSASRTASLAGRKRPRDSDGDLKLKPRRTKSASAGETGQAKSREAFQRGLIAVFVPNALSESVRGEMKSYNELLAYFLPAPLQSEPSLQAVLPLVRTIAANVNLLSPMYHAALVSAIINLPWATGDDRFVRVFVGWAGVLVSAHPDWANEVAIMAVKGLTWQHASSSNTVRSLYHARHHLLLSRLLTLIPTLPNTLGPLLIKYFPHKREREVVQTTYLRNICELTDYCPELGARMWSEVVDRMLRVDVEITRAGEEDDDEDDDEEERLLALMSTSDITGDPFELRLDQDIPLDPIVKEETDGLDDPDQDIDDLSSVEGSVSDAEEETDEMKEAIARARKKLATLLNRRKLDGMMHYFIRHLGESMGARAASPPAAQMAAATLASVSGSGESTPTSEYPSTPTSAQPGTSSFALAAQLPRVRRTPAEGLAAFQTLLNLFSRQILQTSSTQHIPFLLFVASSYSPAHTDLFLGLLVSLSLYGTSSAHSTHLTTGTIASQNQRIAATVYIGGIVCRARFVTDDQARHVLKYLLAYIDGKMLQAKQGRPDELPLFYAVCQAVMMIFCFRWRALAREEEGEEGVVGEMEMDGEAEGLGGEGGRWMAELEVLQRVITSDLNPLLGCNTTVVQTFAKVAHQVNFAYCFSIMESNASAARTASSHSLSALQRAASTPSIARQPSISSLSSASGFPFNAKGVSTPGMTPVSPAFSLNGNGMAQGHAMQNQSLPREARKVNVESGLDSYYPFDPFDLPRTGQVIEPLYWTYGDVAVDASDDEDDSDEDEADSDSAEESEEESDDGDEDDEMAMGTSAMSHHRNPHRSTNNNNNNKLKIPKPTSASYGKGSHGHGHGTSLDRRRALRDSGVLGTSFEGMSISPARAGLTGMA